MLLLQGGSDLDGKDGVVVFLAGCVTVTLGCEGEMIKSSNGGALRGVCVTGTLGCEGGDI